MQKRQGIFSLFLSTVASLLLFVGSAPPAAALVDPTRHVAAAGGVAQEVDALNVPRCTGIEWNWTSSTKTQIRIWAPAHVINGFLYDPIEYGLVWVTITAPGGTVTHSGKYNASIYAGTDFKVPARRGYSAAISLTDDDVTYTFCRGSSLLS